LQLVMPARRMQGERAPLRGGNGGDLFQKARLAERIQLCLARQA
jgi:hypothetical protein